MDETTCDRIIEGALGGRSLTHICRDSGMPSISTVRRFLEGTNPEQVAFKQAYERARAIRETMLMDEMLAVIDDRSRDWVECRNEDGEPYRAPNPEAIRRDKLVVAAMQREVERLERRRMKAQQSDAPVKFVITEVNFMDLPEDVRARYRRHPNVRPRPFD